MPPELLLIESRMLLCLVRSPARGAGLLVGAALHRLDRILLVRGSPLPLGCAVTRGRRIAGSKSALAVFSGGRLFPDLSLLVPRS